MNPGTFEHPVVKKNALRPGIYLAIGENLG
jgi:hypothetical protein